MGAPSCQYNVYNSAAHLPPVLDQTGDCGICLYPIDEPPPIPADELVAPSPAGRSAQVYLQHLCADCAQTSDGAPLSTAEAAVVSHTDAKGMDRTHFRCLRKQIMVSLTGSRNCVLCRKTVFPSSLLTKTETESWQFLQAAQLRLNEIRESLQQVQSVGDQRFIRHHGLIYNLCLCSMGWVETAINMRIFYKSMSALFSTEPIEWPVKEITYFVVGVPVGIALSRFALQSMFKPVQQRPLSRKEASMAYPHVSALPSMLAVPDSCGLCAQPLQRSLERPCEGALKTVTQVPICAASVAVHFKDRECRIYHLPCARKQAHLDVFARQMQSSPLFREEERRGLLTSEEVELVHAIEKGEQSERALYSLRHQMDYLTIAGIAAAFFSGMFPTLRGIAGGEGTSENALSDTIFALTCLSAARLGAALGYIIHTQWAKYRGHVV